MSPLRFMAGSLVFATAALAAAPAQALFHLWYIQEIYSNYNGTVQFIELRATSAGQDRLNGHTITSNSNTFTFNANLGTTVTNTKSLLIATANFGSIPGAVPQDYPLIPLPANFFNPAGDTITFAEGVGEGDEKTFTNLPIDGVNSFKYTTYGAVAPTTSANNPRNFATNQGSVNLPPPPDPDPDGDYNGDGVVDAGDYVHWRKTYNDSVSPSGSGADGNEDGTINDPDYDYWATRFGTVIPGSSSGPIPEPATIVLSLVAWAVLSIVRRRRS